VGSRLRQHPRFLDQQKVEVIVSDRAEMQELWTLDISKGGMFLQTNTPPARGSQLAIKLSTPDGSIQLNGRVVHVQADGVGVAFADLSKEMKQKIERYVDGVADQFTGDLRPSPETEPLEVLLEEARKISNAINASDLYGAIGLPPSATSEQIQATVGELCDRFAHPPRDCPPPKAARLVQLCRQIERTGALFGNPLRRLHYDFQHGHVRAKEREAAGQDVEHLRQVWSDVFPDKAAKSRELLKQAFASQQTGKMEECKALGAEAVENDPFNLELRKALEAWQKGMRVALPPRAASGVAAPAEEEGSGLLQELLELGKKLDTLDYFQLLGVGESASAQEIAKVYLLKSRRYDPEALRGRVPQSVLGIAADYHRRMTVAYKTLSDGMRRREYLATRKPQGAAAANDPELARTRNEMGLVFLRKNDFRQAREMFQTAIDLAPEVVEYQANLAWSYIADADYDRDEAASKARPLLVAAIDKTPSKTADDHKRKARYHYFLGRLQREQGQINAAVESFTTAVELNPRLAEAATELRVINMRKNKK
jgi:tetratricopeptide (TPR) repeat protein/Tfp pilus assembly protein PilZ